jgi:hypothetical protein
VFRLGVKDCEISASTGPVSKEPLCGAMAHNDITEAPHGRVVQDCTIEAIEAHPLGSFVRRERVEMVLVLVGANDYHFEE